MEGWARGTGSEVKEKTHFWLKHGKTDTGTELGRQGEASDGRDIASV